MNENKTIIFICRGHVITLYNPLSSEQGRRELKAVADKCIALGVKPDNCELLSSPTVEEQISAGYLKTCLKLDSFKVIDWLNNNNAPIKILSEGLLRFSEKDFVLFILDKPILEKICDFCGLSSYFIKSGDVFICKLPEGKFDKIY